MRGGLAYVVWDVGSRRSRNAVGEVVVRFDVSAGILYFLGDRAGRPSGALCPKG